MGEWEITAGVTRKLSRNKKAATRGVLASYGGPRTARHLKRDKARLSVNKKVTLTKKSTHINVWPEKTRVGEKTKETCKKGAEETEGLIDIKCGCAIKPVIG